MSLQRRWRRVASAGGLLLLVISANAVVAGPSAVGAPNDASPLVYVTGTGTSGSGQIDAFKLSDIIAGGTPTPVQDDGLGTSGDPSSEAITRNATTSVVVSNLDGSEDTSVVDTGTGAVEGPIAALPGTDEPLVAVAADPSDAALVYELTSVGLLLQVDLGSQSVSQVADLSTQLVAQSSPFTLDTARSLAVQADGTEAYVGAFGTYEDVDGEAVIGIPLATPGSPVTVWAQVSPLAAQRIGVKGLALTPSGDEIFACDHAEVFGLELPLSPTETPSDVVTMEGADSVTVGAHGKSVYAGVVNPNDVASVIGFRIDTPADITTDSLDTVPGFATANPNRGVQLAAAADGATLLATVTLESPQQIEAPYIFDMGLGRLTPTGGPVMNLEPALPLPADLDYPVAVAITPDQAPHAAFTVSPGLAATASSFGAGGSTVKYGSIAKYEWDFGDGTLPVITSSDAITHVFATAGTFVVTLTETDSFGTSTAPAFAGSPASVVTDGPGQTAYRLSSKGAETSETVTIKPKKPGTPTTTTVPSPPKHHHKAPFLTLEPTVGPPGSVVTVTGTHFPASAAVTIEWSTTNASSTAVTVHAHNGDFVAQLLVLVPDLLGPRHVVAVSFTKANRPSFLVVADTEEPGGPSGRPVFRSEGP